MRIDSIIKIHDTYKKQSTSPAKPTAKVSQKDELELSGTAKDFQAVYRLLNASPSIRTDKVNEIKEKIESGTYNVKAEEVAEKILSQLDLKG